MRLLLFFIDCQWLGLVNRVDLGSSGSRVILSSDSKENIECEGHRTDADAQVLHVTKGRRKYELIEDEVVDHRQVTKDLQLASFLILERQQLERLGPNHTESHAKEHQPIEPSKLHWIIEESLVQGKHGDGHEDGLHDVGPT